MTSDDLGYPTYCCMRCGGFSFKVDVKATTKTLGVLCMNGRQVVEVHGVHRNIVHDCPDGGAGIAEIVGLSTTENIRDMSAMDAEEDRPEQKGSLN